MARDCIRECQPKNSPIRACPTPSWSNGGRIRSLKGINAAELRGETMLAEKTARRRIYLDIPVDLVHQLRLSASANRRSVVAEALALLEEALWPDKTTAADAPVGAESYRGAVLYLELTPELLARLQPLADRDYRSISGEAVVVLQAVLQRHQAKIEEAAAVETASEKRRGRPRSKHEVEPQRTRRAQRKTAERW